MTTHSVLAAAVLLGFSSTAAFAGVTFTQVTTVDGKRTSVTKVSADGGNAKMEMVESPDNPFMPPGSYMLVSDGEMLLVNPAARTYARFDTSMFEGIAAMAGQMEITDVEFEKVVDEPGESIEGYRDAALPVQIELDDGHAGHADEDRVEHGRGSVDDDGDRAAGNADASRMRARCRAK